MNNLKNYGVFPLVLGLAIGIPIFLIGAGAAIKSIGFMFSSPTSGSIPIWAILVIAVIIIWLMKRR